MRRGISLLLGSLFLLAGLAACDDPSGGDGQQPPPPTGDSQPLR